MKKVNFENGFVFDKSPITLRFYKYIVTISNHKKQEKGIPSGNVLFTKDGNALYDIINTHGLHTGNTLTFIREYLSDLGYTSVIQDS